ncbi:hypothetical protein SCOR_32145 [Sulfidibacter corallicola]
MPRLSCTASLFRRNQAVLGAPRARELVEGSGECSVTGTHNTFRSSHLWGTVPTSPKSKPAGRPTACPAFPCTASLFRRNQAVLGAPRARGLVGGSGGCSVTGTHNTFRSSYLWGTVPASPGYSGMGRSGNGFWSCAQALLSAEARWSSSRHALRRARKTASSTFWPIKTICWGARGQVRTTPFDRVIYGGLSPPPLATRAWEDRETGSGAVPRPCCQRRRGGRRAGTH